MESGLTVQGVECVVASTRSTASVSLDSKAVLTACTAASIPAICPPHIWRQPEASWMSGFTTDSTALAIIRRAVSPMTIGQTPGFLSKAISRQARRGEIDFWSTYAVQILLATKAKEWQSSLDAPLKDVHSLFHPCASIPDGPADPVMFMAADRIALASIDSKMMGCTS